MRKGIYQRKQHCSILNIDEHAFDFFFFFNFWVLAVNVLLEMNSGKIPCWGSLLFSAALGQGHDSDRAW